MAKIGRNQPCPCGSGKKYKHCCLSRGKTVSTSKTYGTNAGAKAGALSKIEEALARARQKAANREADFWELGVFLFFSTSEGDAWFLEMTECDAVQIAQSGQALDFTLEDAGQTIAINWTHTFALQDKQLIFTSYENHEAQPSPSAPAQRIAAAMRRLRKYYAQNVLAQVHMAEQPELRNAR